MYPFLTLTSFCYEYPRVEASTRFLTTEVSKQVRRSCMCLRLLISIAHLRLLVSTTQKIVNRTIHRSNMSSHIVWEEWQWCEGKSAVGGHWKRQGWRGCMCLAETL